MQNADPPSAVLCVQRVVEKDFPFDQAILLEECACYDADVLRQYYNGSAVFLVATAVRSEMGFVGVLISDVDHDEPGEVYGALKDLAVSCAEDFQDSIREALIRRWQEECRRELWDGLRVSVFPMQEADRASFLKEKFYSVGTCPCCEAEMLEWQPEEKPSHAL